jgi:dienelactone hydrolase
MNMEWRNGGEEERRTVLPFFHSSTLPLLFSKQTSPEQQVEQLQEKEKPMTDSTLNTPTDRRMTEIRRSDTPYPLTPFQAKEDWLAYAADLRQHILVSTGLYPLPEKTPLNARIFGLIERDEYTVEKVFFESYPGFFVTGNLYRPKGKRGPSPAVLNPHGHWKDGRFANDEVGSIPARCISFARLGYVAFSWDMVGYNDSRQIPHSFAHPDTPEGRHANLWGVSLMGLQLWNSIRATDFLTSLPDVNSHRIACTGESGGGTQTFMLCAVDDRISVAAPVNMISAHMQGGCLCENAPNLRLDTNNVEVGAMFAPKPMILVSCTGDWTVNTPSVEFPAIQNVYRLFDGEDSVTYVQMETGHNYNRESREAVYGWFARFLSRRRKMTPIPEPPYTMEPKEDLQVFPDGHPPDNATDEAGLMTYLIENSERQFSDIVPEDRKGLKRFRRVMEPALRHALAVELPVAGSVMSEEYDTTPLDGVTVRSLVIGCKGKGDRIPALLFIPAGTTRLTTLVVHAGGKGSLFNPEKGVPSPLLAGLFRHGHTVLTIDAFQTGEVASERNTDIRYFTTYNRTDTANRVQDILTALAYLTGHNAHPINLVGVGHAGLWCLLARSFVTGVERTVVDVVQFDSTDDDAYLRDLFVPCLRRVGDLRTAGILSAPGKLFIHNTGGRFRTDEIANAYAAAHVRRNLRVERQEADDETIIEWLS